MKTITYLIIIKMGTVPRYLIVNAANCGSRQMNVFSLTALSWKQDYYHLLGILLSYSTFSKGKGLSLLGKEKI